MALLRADPDHQLANYVMAAVAEFSGDLVRMEAFLERTGLQIGIDFDDYNLALHLSAEQSYFENLGRKARTSSCRCRNPPPPS